MVIYAVFLLLLLLVLAMVPTFRVVLFGVLDDLLQLRCFEAG
ncbi:hypothetical protein [Bradyrhizobium sp. NBAIM01]|nr:hypothetical protein [Bradyrhizobium sp. NBAIM01]